MKNTPLSSPEHAAKMILVKAGRADNKKLEAKIARLIKIRDNNLSHTPAYNKASNALFDIIDAL